MDDNDDGWQMTRGSAWVEAAQGATRRPLVFIFYRVEDKIVVVSPPPVEFLCRM